MNRATATVVRLLNIHHRGQQQGFRLALIRVTGHRLQVMALEFVLVQGLIAVLQEASIPTEANRLSSMKSRRVQRKIGLLLGVCGEVDGSDENQLDLLRLV